MVGLTVEQLAGGGDGATGLPEPAGTECRYARTVRRRGDSGSLDQFANAGPDCFWRAGARARLSISDAGIDPSSGVARIAVHGELDLATADQLGAVLSTHRAAGRRTVCLDLSALSFCSVSGLTALLSAHLRYEEAGSMLILTGCDSQLIRYLRLTGLDRILHVAPPPIPAGADAAHPDG